MVVIPTYNESDTIGELLDGLSRRGYRAIVVDDSDDDGKTAEIVIERTACIVRRAQRGGLGSAIARGLRYAEQLGAKYVVVMDAGGTHRPEDVFKLEAVARRFNFNVVIGSRFMEAHRWYSWRTLLSRVATWLMRGLGVVVTDATISFRCYRLDGLLWAALDYTLAQGHAFQFELLTNLVRRGAKVGEVAIPYRLVGRSTLRASTVTEAIETYARLFVWRR